MIDFYRNLQKGMPKDMALREAKLKFINDAQKPHALVHPLFWSGIIGIGDMHGL